jgi:blocked-early-in-transport protein 1
MDDLATKVSALRGITIDIYDNARDQTIIDTSTSTFSSFSNSLQGSATRLTRMAAQGNKIAVFKLAAILVAMVCVLWWLGGWVFGGAGKAA